MILKKTALYGKTMKMLESEQKEILLGKMRMKNKKKQQIELTFIGIHISYTIYDRCAFSYVTTNFLWINQFT